MSFHIIGAEIGSYFSALWGARGRAGAKVIIEMGERRAVLTRRRAGCVRSSVLRVHRLGKAHE